MSDVSRGRLIRAVRLLPGAVRIGRGVMEDVGGPDAEKEAAAAASAPESELRRAELEIRKLRGELRSREADLAESRASIENLRSKIAATAATAEAERTAFLKQAADETERIRKATFDEARIRGEQKGYEEGRVRADEEVGREYAGRFDSALGLLSEIGNSLAQNRQELATHQAPQLIRLWETMLRRMLLAAVTLDPELVRRQIAYILGRVSDRERIIVYLNPADIEAFESMKDEVRDSIRGVKVFELMSDEHVDRGSCLVETALGVYDARWRTQLEQIGSEIDELMMEVMSGDSDAASGE